MDRCSGTVDSAHTLCTVYGNHDEGADSNKAQEAQTAQNGTPFTYTVCADFLPRPKYIEQLHKHFAEASRYASWARCILWGQAGFGKRQLATYFATEYGQQSGRKVLWIDDQGMETFVRDYKQAYLTLTGTQVVPSSPYFSLHYMLSLIRRTLEERHSEWFLVVLNASSDTEVPDSNASGMCPADYFPTRGQTLVTTSSVFGEVVASNGDQPRIWMGIKLAHTLAINIEGLERHEVDQYYEKSCGGSGNDIEHIDCTKELGLGFPQLALSLSHMRWLQIDLLRYTPFMRSLSAKTRSKGDDSAVPRGISLGYPGILDTIWRTVANCDSIAIRILVYISILGPRHLPWHLLQQIRELSEIDANELLKSRSLLAALGLINVQSSQNGEGDEINVHSLLHQWLRNRVREIYASEDEYQHAMFDVIDMMANVVHEAICDRDKLWNIISHVMRVARMCTKHSLESSSCAALFSHFALFLFNEGAFITMGERIINQAISTALLVERVCGEREHGGHCLASMREMRVRMLLFLFRLREAKAELKKAFTAAKTFPLDEKQNQLILHRLRNLEVEVAFQEDDNAKVIRLLEADLMEECFSEFERARKHHWLAKSLIASGSVRPALQHSHMAVSHWYGLPDKWKQAEMLRWVDWHTTILKRAGKCRAASLILPELLDHYLLFIPPASEEIWRSACVLGKSLSHIEDHEAWIVRVLSAAKVSELHGRSLTYCLLMLHDFATILQARGRLVEAEGIYRHNIDIATFRKPPTLGDDGPYDYTMDRILLVACVYGQGRHKEARAMRKLFKTQQGFNDNPTAKEDLRVVLQARYRDDHVFLEAYRAALQTRREGHEQSLLGYSVSVMEHALRRYGCLEDRLHEYGDPMFDIDSTGIGFARRSQVLHLLEYDMVYLAFFDRNGKSDDLWAPLDQGVLGQYFNFCECRRHRRRSGSLNPVELIEGRFLRKIPDGDIKLKPKKKQIPIYKWLRRSRCDTGREYFGDSLSEQEIETFTRQASQEKSYRISCSNSENCLTKCFGFKKHSHRPRFWTGKDAVDFDPQTGELTWVPFFLQERDHAFDMEHVAIPNALSIPIIRITGADGAPAGPEIQDISKQELQMRITSYFPKLKHSFVGHPVCPRLRQIEEDDES